MTLWWNHSSSSSNGQRQKVTFYESKIIMWGILTLMDLSYDALRKKKCLLTIGHFSRLKKKICFLQAIVFFLLGKRKISRDGQVLITVPYFSIGNSWWLPIAVADTKAKKIQLKNRSSLSPPWQLDTFFCHCVKRNSIYQKWNWISLVLGKNCQQDKRFFSLMEKKTVFWIKET